MDSSGHIAIDSWGGGGGGGGGIAVVMAISGLAQRVGQQVQSLTVAYGPELQTLRQTWSVHGNPILAAADQLSQAAQTAGQGGNTAGPGGLGPNDPWDRFNSLLGQGKSDIDAAVEASTQGSGDRFVIGPYNAPPGTLNYIAEANGPSGGKYFNAGTKLWDQLAQKGIAGQVNRQAIYEQMKAGIRRIDISSGLTIDQVKKLYPDKWLGKEVEWIQEFARLFGYIENTTGTGWIKP